VKTPRPRRAVDDCLGWRCMLPERGEEEDGGLEYELEKLGVGEEDRKKVHAKLWASVRAALDKVERSAVAGRRLGHIAYMEEVREGVRITYGDLSLYMSDSALEQIRSLYCYGTDRKEPSSPLFVCRLYALAARYRGLGGESYQGCMSAELMGKLREALPIDAECFASPMNVTLPHRFCSAYPDVELPFASICSFQEMHLYSPVMQHGGSFEAYPPFVEELMLAMYLYIHALLLHISAPLSFCIFIPAWDDTPAVQAIRACPYLTFERKIEKYRYRYRAGYHYLPGRGNTLIPYSSSYVFVLQNASGSDKYPPHRLGDIF